jgi:uncharacterized LabA/DUF88 family protein
MKNFGWDLDYRRFKIYLSEHYGVNKTYYFIGYVPENTDLYNYLQDVGYHLVFKPILKTRKGKIKGNCDTELVLQSMIDLNKYEKAILVSSDGDFYCLVSYLLNVNKLECVLAPCEESCSVLLIKAAKGRIAYVDKLKQILEYKRKEPHKDGTL